MRLKRLICSLTSAIMVLTSIAITSFTSTSAADEDGLISPPTGGWLTKEQQDSTSEYKLCKVYDYNNMPVIQDIYQATELYIAFKIVNVDVNHPLKAWFAHSNGLDWDDYAEDEATPATIIDKERGTYVVKWSGSPISSNSVMYLGVKFEGVKNPADAYNERYCNTKTNVELIGLYNKEPDFYKLPQTTETESTEPIPEGALPIYLTDENFNSLTVTSCVYALKDGQYTITAEGVNRCAKDISLILYSKDAANIISKDTMIVLNKFILNGESYTIPNCWSSPVSPFPEIDEVSHVRSNDFCVCPWDPDLKNDSVDLLENEVMQTISITFTLSDTKLGEADTSAPDTSDTSNSDDTSNSNNTSNPGDQSNTTSTTASAIAGFKATTAPIIKTTIVKPAKVKNVNIAAKKNKLRVSWKKVSGATGYKVVLATNKKLTKNKRTFTVKKNKVKIKKLKSRKKYFLKVRAYKLANGKKYNGKWSKVVNKKTK